MKILQVGSSLTHSSGIEKYIIGLTQGLQSLGHDVHISAPSGSWLYRTAESIGATTHGLRIWHQHDLFGLPSHRTLLRRERFDVVNVHFSKDYLVPTLAARLEGQRGIVITRHMCHCWPHVRRWMFGSLLSDHIIGVSEAVRRAMLNGGVQGSRLSAILSGIEVPLLKAAPDLRLELALPPSTILIAIISRLIPEKGHKFLLDAMRQVKGDAVCLIVGDGRERDSLQRYVRKHSLGSRVRFLGWREDTDAVMQAIDIIALPSLWEEACSLSILEGMAAGKPLVVTRSGGNPELVEDCVNGFLVAKNDVKGLADALTRLVNDRTLRRDMGDASLARQQTCFNRERMARETEEVYLNLLAQDFKVPVCS